MQSLLTVFRCWSGLALVLVFSVVTQAQVNESINVLGALSANPSVKIQGANSPCAVVAGCKYDFSFVPPSCDVSYVNWTLYDGQVGGTIISTSYFDPSLTISAQPATQVLQVELSGTCHDEFGDYSYSGYGTITLVPQELNATTIALVASSNPVCVNTPFTLSVQGVAGVTAVDWSFPGGGGTYSTTDGSNGFAWAIWGGITAATTYTATIYSCSSAPIAKTIVMEPSRELANSTVAGERDVLVGDNQGSVTLINYKGVIQHWQQSPDGIVWTNVNQTTEELPYENLTATTLFRAVTTVCGINYTSGACTIRVHNYTDNLSWTGAQTFAADGTTLLGAARTYVDGFAKPIQSQAKSLSTDRVLATEPLYGKYKQVVGTTLAAPTNYGDFAYVPNFVSPASAAGAHYDYTRFDEAATLNSPEAVDNTQVGTLGWYYSTNNNLEPYTAVTAYPYSRSAAVADGSTGVGRSAGPAPGLQVGSEHEAVQGSFTVRTELDDYATIRNELLPGNVLGAQPGTLQGVSVQTLGQDADGNAALTFADQQGHAVMSARPATSVDAWATVTNTVEVGWPYSAQVTYGGTPMLFDATADLILHNSQGQWVTAGNSEAIANALAATGQSGQQYTLYSSEPFTVISYTNNPPLGLTTSVVVAQWREAYPFYNFYIIGDGYATITSQPSTPNAEYEILNSVTGQLVTLLANATLGPGCYQVRILKGSISLTYKNQFKDISYNFFDQKGQLLESVAPNGVQQLLADLASNGPSGLQATFTTTYEYNQRGQLTTRTETDAGTTAYYYRTDGKLRFSQNEKQRALSRFSYVHYDAIGRLVETGEYDDDNGSFPAYSTKSYYLDYVAVGGIHEQGGLDCALRRDVVYTFYDQLPAGFTTPDGYTPTFLYGRVSATLKAQRSDPCADLDETSRTLYSYDDQGRVQWVVRQLLGSGNPFRTIDYTYDAAGNAARVYYQKDKPLESLTHYYRYDADNRLSWVGAGRNGSDPVEQARYSYYLHGPLKRVVYGQDLQGVDYTYTVAGALKAINDGNLKADPGHDGDGRTGTRYRDFFGASLHYYQNDYNSAAVPTQTTTMASGSDYQPHYNGLVSGISWQTGSLLNAYGYNYDDKGQLLKAAYGRMLGNAFVPSATNSYSETLPNSSSTPAYDPNGNIQYLQRTDGTGNAMPVLDAAYDYFGESNLLQQVRVGGVPATSYKYGEIGEVIAQQEIDPSQNKYLAYDASGKVTAIYADEDHRKPIALYTYDEFGMRVQQRVYLVAGEPDSYLTTVFVRDLGGHELASYLIKTNKWVTEREAIYEQPIYGLARLGIYRNARDRQPAEQLYELNDHLGNTRIVFRRPVPVQYVLSMEDSRVTQEKQDFPGPNATTYDKVRSKAQGLPNSPYNSGYSRYSMRLQGTQGPTKTIAAQRGDKFHLAAYSYYTELAEALTPTTPPSTARHGLSRLVAGLLGAGVVSIKPLPRLPEQSPTIRNGRPQPLGQLALGVSVTLAAATAKDATTLRTTAGPPSAVLRCRILRADDNSVVRVISSDNVAVPSSQWNTLSLDVEITEDFPVNVEVFAVSTDASNTVYFDDLTVDYTPGPVIEENHFYAYGQKLDGLSWRRAEERPYGRGYQGQYTTQDEESGYTVFDLRMYDARYGRWLAGDPYGQFSSPYVGMGNNPVSGIDPDGGWLFGLFGSTAAQRHGAKEFAASHGGEVVDYYRKTIWVSWNNDEAAVGTRFTRNGTPGSVGNENHDHQLDAMAANDYAAWRASHFQPDPGIAEPDHTIESLFLPVPKGIGALKWSSAGRLFWSGGTEAMEAAANFAAANGMKTMEMTIPGRVMTKLSPHLPESISSYMWNGLSRQYARGAEGTVQVFQNATNGVSLKSVWRTTEYPVLLQGQNEIIFHNVIIP